MDLGPLYSDLRCRECKSAGAFGNGLCPRHQPNPGRVLLENLGDFVVAQPLVAFMIVIVILGILGINLG